MWTVCPVARAPNSTELPACWDPEVADNVGLAANGWTRELCEAEGYTWLPEDLWVSSDAEVEVAQDQAEPAPVGQPGELPATQPAPAQQSSPQYTG